MNPDEGGRNAVAILTASFNKEWGSLAGLLNDLSERELGEVAVVMAAYVIETAAMLDLPFDEVLTGLGTRVA